MDNKQSFGDDLGKDKGDWGHHCNCRPSAVFYAQKGDKKIGCNHRCRDIYHIIAHKNGYDKLPWLGKEIVNQVNFFVAAFFKSFPLNKGQGEKSGFRT